MTLKQLKKQLKNKTALENFTALKTYYYSNTAEGITQDDLKEILTLIDDRGRNPVDQKAPPALIRYLLAINYGTPVNTLKFLNFLINHSNDTLSIIQSYQQTLFNEICKNQNIVLWNWLFDECKLRISEDDNVLLKILLSEIDKNPDPVFVGYFFHQIHKKNTKPVETLCLATQYGCYNLVKLIISEKDGGKIINAVDRYDVTPLQYAVIKKQLAIMELLLSYALKITEDKLISLFQTVIYQQNIEALVKLIIYIRNSGHPNFIQDMRDENNWTFLHRAIFCEPSTNSEPSQFFCFLLRQFKSLIPELRDRNGLNLAVFACVHNKPFIAQYLLDTYPSLTLFEKRENNINALHDAIEYRAFSSAKWLIETKGFDINEQTMDGQSPLLFAAEVEFNEFITFALAHSHTDTRITDNRKRHLGHYLIDKYGEVELIQDLLNRRKIDLLAQDEDGLTMLDFELRKPTPDVQKLNLLFHMVDNVSKKDKEKSNHLILTSPYLKQFILFFCETHSTLDFYMASGQKPLHIACKYVDFAFAQHLVTTFQLNINERNQVGETVFCYLIKNQPLKDALVFYEIFSPDLRNLDARHSSLLHISVELQLLDLVKWCVTKTNLSGCILDQRNDELSALDIALIKRNLPILTCLWNELDENKRSDYARKLKATEPDQYNYLIENDLVKEIKVAEKIEIEEPSLSAPLFPSVQNPDSILAFQSSSLKTRDDIATTPSEKDTRLAFCKSTFIQAIKEKNLPYIKRLKHHPEHAESIKTIAEEALRTAIEENVHSIFYQLLRIPSIRAEAHVNDNAALKLAQSLNHNNLITYLLEIPQVQSAYNKENKVDRLNVDASEWIGKPVCYLTNAYLKYLIDKLNTFVCTELSCEIDIHLYGSSIYKTNPNDFDLLFSSIDTWDKKAEVYKFINFLCINGGNITFFDPFTKEAGYYSPQNNPTRHVIPMDWMGFKLDLVIVKVSQSEHAKNGDFTVAALYFNLREFSFERTHYLQAYTDLQLKRLDTIIDPEESFRSDLSRVFRAVRILTSDNNFILSERCVTAIQHLFCGTENHFANLDMLPCGKLYQQLDLLFSSNDVHGSIEILASLGVLNSLLTHLDALTNQRASYYRQQFVSYRSMSSLETSPTYQGNSFSFFAGSHSQLLPQTTHQTTKFDSSY